MQRSVDSWTNCDPHIMATTLSPAAVFYALQDAQRDILALHALATRVGALNPAAGEIGAGMLASLVEEARRVLEVHL